jgi:rhodanese-related sulfurtransferase
MVQQITVQQAKELIATGDVEVVDVREPNEWAAGHLPGARHVPLGQLRTDAKAALVRDGLVFVCAAGIRSQAAARIAESYGLTRVFNLTGGTQSWARAGFPLIRERTAA